MLRDRFRTTLQLLISFPGCFFVASGAGPSGWRLFFICDVTILQELCFLSCEGSKMKLRFALLAVALLCFAVRCFPSDEVTLNVEGTKRLFLLHVPPGHSTSPMPVVIAFHGFNETAANLEKVT